MWPTGQKNYKKGQYDKKYLKIALLTKKSSKIANPTKNL